MRFWEKMRTFLCIFPIIHTKTPENADANEDLRKRFEKWRVTKRCIIFKSICVMHRQVKRELENVQDCITYCLFHPQFGPSRRKRSQNVYIS